MSLRASVFRVEIEDLELIDGEKVRHIHYVSSDSFRGAMMSAQALLEKEGYFQEEKYEMGKLTIKELGALNVGVSGES